MGISRLTFAGNLALVYQDDGSVVRLVPSVHNQWVPTTDAGTDPPPAGTQADLVAWMVAHISAFAYSQASGRLSPLTSGYTDCSGLTWFCYKTVTGIDIGTWTGAQQGSGTVIQDGLAGSSPTEANMVLGDLVFYSWSGPNSNYDHVDMYTGPNQVLGHGGPESGPTYKVMNTRCAAAYEWRVRRYL
jgi:cell wall-associated NlpC family hydrolase